MKLISWICRNCRASGQSRVRTRLLSSVSGVEGRKRVGDLGVLHNYISKLEKELLKSDRKPVPKPEFKEAEVLDDIERLYAALSIEQEAPTKGFPILQVVADRIGMELVASGADDLDWGAIITRLEKTGGFTYESHTENALLQYMPSHIRGQYMRQLLVLAKNSPSSDRLTYDLLLDGCAEVGDHAGAEELFAIAKTLAQPRKLSVYTYAHMFKAYTRKIDFSRILELFQEMRNEGVLPNTVVYTTIMAACVKSNSLTTARNIFDFLKYSATDLQPDVETYNVMIQSCAKSKESERAINLFNELKLDSPLSGQRRVNKVPTAKTYDALIQACVVRKDFAQQAWLYAQEMRDKGFPTTLHTCESLLVACASTGDIHQAHTLISLLITQGSISEMAWTSLFHAYANFWAKISAGKGQTSAPLSLPLTLGTEALFGHRAINSVAELKDQATAVFAHIRTNYPDCITTHLTNAYFSVIVEKSRFKADFSAAKALWSDLYITTIADEFSYEKAMVLASKSRDAEFGTLIWRERAEKWPGKTPSRAMLRIIVQYLATMGRLQDGLDFMKTWDKTQWTVEEVQPLLTRAVQAGMPELAAEIQEMTVRNASRLESNERRRKAASKW